MLELGDDDGGVAHRARGQGGDGEWRRDEDSLERDIPRDLRKRFERSATARAIDAHRLDTLLLVLRAKSRTALEGATKAYQQFAELYNAGELAEAWPLLSEVVWSLQMILRSDDWEMRELIGSGMLPAALDLQAKILDELSTLSVP